MVRWPLLAGFLKFDVARSFAFILWFLFFNNSVFLVSLSVIFLSQGTSR